MYPHFEYKYPAVSEKGIRYMSIQHQGKVPNEPEKILISYRCQLITCLINTSEIIYLVQIISSKW